MKKKNDKGLMTSQHYIDDKWTHFWPVEVVPYIEL